MTMKEPAHELHNRLVGPVVASIVRPVIASGGSPEDILVLGESVLTGVILAVTKLGGDEPVLEVVFERVKQRLAEQRLGPIQAKGSA